MALTPLFVANAETLLKALRQSGAVEDPGNSIHALLEHAHQKVRAEILQKLGSALVVVIQGIPFNATGTTDADQIRSLANLVEIELMKYYFWPEVRVFFGSGTSKIHEAWNTGYLATLTEEGFDQAQSNRRKEIDKLFGYLSQQTTSAAPSTSGVASSIGPSTAPPRLGAIPFSGHQNLWQSPKIQT